MSGRCNTLCEYDVTDESSHFYLYLFGHTHFSTFPFFLPCHNSSIPFSVFIIILLPFFHPLFHNSFSFTLVIFFLPSYKKLPILISPSFFHLSFHRHLFFIPFSHFLFANCLLVPLPPSHSSIPLPLLQWHQCVLMTTRAEEAASCLKTLRLIPPAAWVRLPAARKRSCHPAPSPAPPRLPPTCPPPLPPRPPLHPPPPPRPPRLLCPGPAVLTFPAPCRCLTSA